MAFEKMRARWRQDSQFGRDQVDALKRIRVDATKQLGAGGWRNYLSQLGGKGPPLTEEAERRLVRLDHTFNVCFVILALYVGLVAAWGYSFVAATAAIPMLVILFGGVIPCRLILRRRRLPESHRIEYHPPGRSLPPNL